MLLGLCALQVKPEAWANVILLMQFMTDNHIESHSQEGNEEDGLGGRHKEKLGET